MSTNDSNLDWQNSADWNEFDWESALKKGDRFAHIYFKMLNRFGDFPDRIPIIEEQLKNELVKDKALIDSDFILASEAALFSEEFNEGEEEMIDELGAIEDNPTYMNLKKTSLGWCNIVSSLLRQEDKETGLKILYYLGRCLATIICTLENDRNNSGNTAFYKRTLFYLNSSIGLLHKLRENYASIAVILDEVIKHLSQIHDETVDALIESRRRSKSGEDTFDEDEDDYDDDEDDDADDYSEEDDYPPF